MCLRLIVPTLSFPGLFAPFSFPLRSSAPAALSSKYEVVGVRRSNWKDRSGRTITRAGIGIPGVIWAVLALNSLQKSIDLTPLLPRAGPTGGLGVACPAPTISFTIWSVNARAFDILAVVLCKVEMWLRLDNFWGIKVVWSLKYEATTMLES